MHKVVELVIEAISEDARNNSGRFEPDGFANYFPEEEDHHVHDAWLEYENMRDGHKTLEQVVAKYAKVA